MGMHIVILYSSASDSRNNQHPVPEEMAIIYIVLILGAMYTAMD